MIDLWYRNAIIYCLDVGTFADSTGSRVGDFRGLSERLPYLAGIGITRLWLTSFYPSPWRDHRYDIAEDYSVDPPLWHAPRVRRLHSPSPINAACV